MKGGMDEWKEGWMSGRRNGCVERVMEEWKEGGMSVKIEG